MASRQIYSCNVCRDEYQGDKAREKLIGFEFDHRNEIGPVLKDVHSVENHVCRRCLVGLVNLAAMVFPAGKGER